MAELSNWRNVLVIQRNRTGCIPTGFEWLIRYLGITNVSLATFQDDFDLERRHIGENNFDSVADAVMSRYPHLSINSREFDSGQTKIEFIRDLIARDVPCVMSLTLSPSGGWHIVPVVSIDDQRIKIIYVVNRYGYQSHDYPIAELVYRHNNWSGGKDIAWVQPAPAKHGNSNIIGTSYKFT